MSAITDFQAASIEVKAARHMEFVAFWKAFPVGAEIQWKTRGVIHSGTVSSVLKFFDYDQELSLRATNSKSGREVTVTPKMIVMPELVS